MATKKTESKGLFKSEQTTDEVNDLNRALRKSQGEVASLQKKVLELEAELSKKSSNSKDCVVLDGSECKVILRETVAELVQALRRNEVNEDATVLVLNKYGG